MDSGKGNISVDRIRQLARVFSAIIILLTVLIAVGHIFGDEPTAEDYPPIENLMPILIGLSVAGLGIAWRWEAIGSALSILFFLAHLGLFRALRGEFFPLGMLAIFLPIPITAFLFIWCWLRSHK